MNKKLQKARIGLLLDEPFFGALLLNLKVTEAKGIGTMATDSVVLKYDPEFTDKLSDIELKTVLAHEALHCYSEGTMIITSTGLRAIKEIQAGDRVWSNRGIFTEVLATSRRPYKGEALRITPAFGLPFTLTPEHPLLTYRATRLERNLGFAKSLRIWGSKTMSGALRFRPAGQLTDKDCLVMQAPIDYGISKRKRVKMYRTRSSYTVHKVRLNEDTAYFLGWFVGDGSLHKPSGKGNWFGAPKDKRVICLTLGTNNDHIRLESVIREKLFRSVTITDLSPIKAKRLTFSSTSMSRYLRKHFVSSKGEKVIPPFMLGMSPEIIRGFVQGLLESDGHISVQSGYSVSNTSRSVAGMLPLLLLKVGHLPTIKIRKRNLPNQDCYKICWNPKPKLNSKGYRIGNKWLLPIRSIERIAIDEPVFNLETKAHTYAHAFAITHNCALLHPLRRGQRDARVWNMACDYAINQLLVDSNTGAVAKGRPQPFKLPDGGLIDAKYKGLTADGIYSQLAQKPQPKDTPGDKPSNDPGGMGGVEDHKAASESEQTEQEARWKVALTQAASMAKSRGDIPGELKRLIEDILEPKADWRELLREFINSRDCTDYVWSKPNPRYTHSGFILPSLNNESLGTVIVAGDCSGSMWGIIEKVFSEAQSILFSCNPKQLVFAQFDTSIQQWDEIERGDKIPSEARGFGGTDFRCIFDEIDKRDMQADCLIVITDGDGTFPNEIPGIPCIWALTNNHVKPPFGETICLDMQST